MDSHTYFTETILDVRYLDLYIARNSILKSLQNVLPKMKGTILDVGCGYMPYRSMVLSSPSKGQHYIGLDLEGSQYTTPDLLWDGQTIPMETASVECAIATEVFEHCSQPETVMKEIHRVLKPGGFLFFTVPFLWNLHETPHDHYRYTPFSLERHLRNSGFTRVDITALGGWDASLGQMLSLWARRRWVGKGFNRILRLAFSMFLLPLVWMLHKLDKPPLEFSNGTMITGLSGVATKTDLVE